MEISLSNGYSPIIINLFLYKNFTNINEFRNFWFHTTLHKYVKKYILYSKRVVGFVVFSDFLIYKVKTL